MKRSINIGNANLAIESKGLTQTEISKQLNVSREAVSQWFNKKSFPRPNKLLQLGKILELNFDELVSKEDELAPKIAFRKMKGTKTKNHHIEKAQDMGCFLEHLTPYLPFDTTEMPPILRKPVCNYEYLNKIALKVRKDLKIDKFQKVDFHHLIGHFSTLQAVIIPVLWGSKLRHENAIHIFLPKSQTTWIYLNLDTNIHDFKFWMAHELGHCLSPSLEGEDAEDFADAFAATLLFPHQLAEIAYITINGEKTIANKISKILTIAKEQVISPNTVMKQVDAYAKFENITKINLGKNPYGAFTNFNKKYPNLSETIFGDIEKLSPKEFIKKSQQNFNTPFYSMLGKYLKQHKKGHGFVQTIMDIPLLDARGIHAELT